MTSDPLAPDLREAIERGGDLSLAYLPELSFATGRVVGMDALARWDHPALGPIPPSRFVPLALELGLLATLTEWVLKTAFRQCRVWRDDGHELDVSVNLAPANLRDDRLPRLVAVQGRALGVLPEWIHLEIPQSVIRAADDQVVGLATALRSVGAFLVVDSADPTLEAEEAPRVTVDAIKLQQEMVRRVGEPAVAGAILAMTLRARAEGAIVIAQGIEDQATYDALAALGCDRAQGFLISRPLAPVELATWLRSPRPHAPAGDR